MTCDKGIESKSAEKSASVGLGGGLKSESSVRRFVQVLWLYSSVATQEHDHVAIVIDVINERITAVRSSVEVLTMFSVG